MKSLIIAMGALVDKEKTIRLTVNQLIEEGNFDIIEKVFSVNYVVHAGVKEYKGHDFIKKFVKQLRSAIPDIKVVSIEFLNQSDNTITWKRTFSGTHKKNMKGIPASEKKIKWADMVVSSFENEKISEEWIVSELMGELLLKVPTK